MRTVPPIALLFDPGGICDRVIRHWRNSGMTLQATLIKLKLTDEIYGHEQIKWIVLRVSCLLALSAS